MSNHFEPLNHMPEQFGHNPRAESPQPTNLIAAIKKDTEALARYGVEISRENRKKYPTDESRGMDPATADQFLSDFARLGKQALGPETPGVDHAGEGSQQ